MCHVQQFWTTVHLSAHSWPVYHQGFFWYYPIRIQWHSPCEISQSKYRNIQQSIWNINYFVVFVVAQAPWWQHKCLNFKISLYLIVNVPCLTGLLFCLFAYTLQTHPKNKGDKEKTTIIRINKNNNNNNNKNSHESSSSSSSSSTSSTYYTLFTKIVQLLN